MLTRTMHPGALHPGLAGGGDPLPFVQVPFAHTPFWSCGFQLTVTSLVETFWMETAAKLITAA